MWRISAFVAQIRRTSIGMVCVLPKRLICRFSIAVAASIAWEAKDYRFHQGTKYHWWQLPSVRLLTFCIGECSLFKAEQFTFEKLFGDTSQVDGNKGLPYRGSSGIAVGQSRLFPFRFLPKSECWHLYC